VITLARLAAAERAPAELEADPERRAVLRDRLDAAAPVESEWCGPAYRFPDDLVAPRDTAPLAACERARVAERFPQVGSLAEREPILAAREDGQVVSLCYAATRPGPAAEAGVETLPEARGRGHAARVTAAWACAQRARGVIPLYSTSWQNRASRAVARKLGLILYASDLHMR